MTAAIAVKQLHKHFGSVHALRGVDLEVQPGEFFGLLGPNGAGKSTLINILAGLTRPDAGHAAVLGHDVQRDALAARRILGVVPQELVFDPFFEVRDFLRIQAGYYGLARQHKAWIDELLGALGLADKAGANMRDLSGGMKRRVLIAQALVHKPRVLVLDEPTAGVDVELRQTLWAFAQRLHAEGMTIVLTTHYLEEAEALCDRIAIMSHGAVVALDDKSGLLARLPWYQVHVRLANEPAALPPEVNACLVSRDQGWLVLRVERDTDALSHVLTALHTAGLSVLEITSKEQTLEHVFLALTSGHRLIDAA
ncbi:MAG: ABC transporter ATP-binding protein [Immundisolibacter sp.]|uniref:ABC transporter ATP-binding protein n=1 Tax=Immundisolibacter sp. TaxID=1934948 RepID=UPI003EE1DF0B